MKDVEYCTNVKGIYALKQRITVAVVTIEEDM